MENSKFEFQEWPNKEQFINISSRIVLFRKGEAGGLGERSAFKG